MCLYQLPCCHHLHALLLTSITFLAATPSSYFYHLPCSHHVYSPPCCHHLSWSSSLLRAATIFIGPPFCHCPSLCCYHPSGCLCHHSPRCVIAVFVALHHYSPIHITFTICYPQLCYLCHNFKVILIYLSSECNICNTTGLGGCPNTNSYGVCFVDS